MSTEQVTSQAPRSFGEALSRLRQNFKPRARLATWRLRLVFGLTLMVFSEIVVWQNPVARQWYEWLVLAALYVALGSFLLDLIVRFQVHTPAAIGLACGVYGLLSGSIVNHGAYHNVPIGLIVRVLGLQVGAAFLALMLFLYVMRGKTPPLLAVGAAALVGVAWGIWTAWYPAQPNIRWEVPLRQTAYLYLIVPFVGLGALYAFFMPRFEVLRELNVSLLWWEMIACGAPLFFSLLIGIANNTIPALELLLPAAIFAFCLWALRFQQPESDPSILARITFSAPSLIAYVLLVAPLIFFGILAFDATSGDLFPVGTLLYVIVAGFGSAWLPFASGLIFWTVLRTEYPARRKKRVK
ncbi:MAG: hypothetical protein RML95_15695 [Anaerolineae bacterium]|nr:hypothetical protein [Anaerolineae bacterium]MDW8300776.1 hypothetical protein [Anaerolineae bacterium]